MVMSDPEQVDVTNTEDEPGSSCSASKCAYCGCQKDGVLVFYCEQCSRWIHASCLHSGPPSSILADNYYTFKCSNCTGDGKETFERMKLTWVQVVTLALYNLAQTSLGKQGFFKWKEDICVFIDKHWESFFGSNKKRSPQWSCTVGSTLSSGNPHRFQSGYGIFKDAGWWRLVDPTEAPEYRPGMTTVSTPRPRSTRKSHFGMSSARSSARKRYHATLAQQAAEKSAKQACLKETGLAPQALSENSPTKAPGNKHKLKADSCCNGQEISNAEAVGFVDSPRSSHLADPNSMPSSPASSNSSESRKELRIDPTLPLVAISDDEADSDIIDMKKECMDFYDFQKTSTGPIINKPVTIKTEAIVATIQTDSNEDKMTSINEVTQSLQTTEPRVMLMSLYDEQKLLKKLLSLPSTDHDLEGRRLKRKLILRQKKRELGLPVFNFDATVRQLQAKESGISINSDLTSSDSSLATNRFFDQRILDRFLSVDTKLHSSVASGLTFRQKLIGSDGSSDRQMIVSPYTQRMLKPFIRRDFENKPPKLKLLEEVISHYHRPDPTWKADPSSPIDFCYVRPRHIPTVNALCGHFFWPGVDLSESLQYPDFSVVALYKKMVIGFGFLVPDVAFNEAYVSFLLVHPDWQRSGIGTFMLYHLIQTCMGKDVTLHVSASNPAMLLYQRFGFKPERFEADFYDKYLPPDTSDCTHAFFMRLRR